MPADTELRERIAKLEVRVTHLETTLDGIDTKLDTLIQSVSRYRGAGFVLWSIITMAGVAVANAFFKHW